MYQSSIASLPLVARGKVRDIYAVGGDMLLIVATDRLSAFDVVMTDTIPGKGVILTELTLFWLNLLKSARPNHLTGINPSSVVDPQDQDQLIARSMLVKKLKPIPIEAVVRGYLTGSALIEYKKSQSICGLPLPSGLVEGSKFPGPIFTPALKATAGQHDENASLETISAKFGGDLAQSIRRTCIDIYIEASEIALNKGLIIADSKFEFGLSATGELTLMDEVITPDSSRFWSAETYREGVSNVSFDKQPVRDWLASAQDGAALWNKTSPAPNLPPDVIRATSDRYRLVTKLLTS